MAIVDAVLRARIGVEGFGSGTAGMVLWGSATSSGCFRRLADWNDWATMNL